MKVLIALVCASDEPKVLTNEMFVVIITDEFAQLNRSFWHVSVLLLLVFVCIEDVSCARSG